MKKRNLSPKAREAFMKFKEELAEEMTSDMHETGDHITKMKRNEREEKYNNLGRS